ncbi:hypothetical protein TSARBOMBA_257 [Bacillus phage TsarBomba]|uniref:Uncharacterized protein n=1 Tax=Bacillus phage TsarBomba TaxID=1690456 RepID=A0A0K2D0H4_9CAUD|nr:hypothetical protein TSARBOMBA_7 [Bacillus phage TsarBomba]YP_009207072.1 hypothetical protein TSARBOMBA_257 [Bacillus phage TsarBomba]ALA13096.1 hypothetical protein TSARBOMBA_257 [Bacillus phage TsarBomba]ALA13123.1 hypothetical protein TSARBOMBA_7 [Bacillus phage TsarBomba]
MEMLRVAEFEGAKATMNVLEGVKRIVANESYTNEAIAAVERQLEENEEKELFDLLIEHGTKVIASYPISNNHGFAIIYLDSDKAIIQDGEYYALCEIDDRGEHIVYDSFEIPLAECMRV